MTQPKGIILHVYRAADGGDCTSGGISSKVDSFVLVGTKMQGQKDWTPLDRNSQVHEPTVVTPAVVLVESRAKGPLFGPHLEPLEWVENGVPEGYVGPMAGGNYAGTADSRFNVLGQTVFKGTRLDAVSIHDRIETTEMYRHLSSD